MSRVCPACHNDAGFDVARCPSCGEPMAGGPAAKPAMDPPTDRWAKNVERPNVPRSSGVRLHFNNRDEFYEAIDETHMETAATQVGSDGDPTVVERPRVQAADDATVIVRKRHRVDGPLAYLVERSGVRAGKVHLLAKDTNIGRAPESEIILGDESVSRRHAKIRLEEGRFVYWDLASANHSRLVAADGTRTRILEPRPLEDGDTIDLGEARVTFLLVEPEVAGDDDA
jgi:hypothetical protein